MYPRKHIRIELIYTGNLELSDSLLLLFLKPKWWVKRKTALQRKHLEVTINNLVAVCTYVGRHSPTNVSWTVSCKVSKFHRHSDRNMFYQLFTADTDDFLIHVLYMLICGYSNLLRSKMCTVQGSCSGIFIIFAWNWVSTLIYPLCRSERKHSPLLHIFCKASSWIQVVRAPGDCL